MNTTWYDDLARTAIANALPEDKTLETILTSDEVELLPLVNAAFMVRKHFHGREVTIHVLNNVQNGQCPEDCSYCAQSGKSRAEIATYTTKSDEEILAEAHEAYLAGAHRYCMVYAGRQPSSKRIEKISSLVTTIKQKYPLEVCVSAGLVDEKGASRLKAAGLDRLNHNLNTAESRYGRICTTHTFADRLGTLRAAKKAGLEVCSGIIAGMGETPDELIELALRLREVGARSIPINFLVPIAGNILDAPVNLSPQFCLRILCLFRFVIPTAEIRTAAGREFHLRDLEVLSLYAANSLFLDGYLNAKGSSRRRTLQMIKDGGFTIKSEHSLDRLLAQERDGTEGVDHQEIELKTARDLRPAL